MTVSDHLGGYGEGVHGDVGTWFPTLWTWLVQGPLRVRSVLDLGCGEGHSLNYLRGLGVEVVGVEGVPQEDPMIVQHDFTKGSYAPGRTFDMVWCCEFVEHVEERYAQNFTMCLQSAPMVLMTHAFPGQGGFHHVNCRDREYWQGFFAAIGFVFEEHLTVTTRAFAARDDSPWNHFVRSGMVFRKP